MTRRKIGRIKRRETDPASNQFPKSSPHPRTHRVSWSWIEKRRGSEEIEVNLWRKGESKGGENNQASNHTPK